MNKKRWLPMGVAALLCVNVLSVSAQELTDTDPARMTDVTASVETDTGEVTYIVSIPDKIDFGKLQKPIDNTSANIKSVEFTVTATEINNLDTATSRVVVLLQDAATEDGFLITGQDATNQEKTLTYNVLNSAGVDITAGEKYTNGYALAAFSVADQSTSAKLQLDQNQLYMKNLNEWAGNYSGQINFYSTVASVNDFN